MSQPNWDAAPEGATHWMPDNHSYGDSFIKQDGPRLSFYSQRYREWVVRDDLSKYRATFIPRPTHQLDKPWDGNGLPKVGTVCEGKPARAWHTVEVIGYYQERRVWVRWFDPSGTTNYEEFDSWEVDEIEFRPIRTPEQIAAQDRQDDIIRLGLDGGIGEHTAARLYDAGWRKPA